MEPIAIGTLIAAAGVVSGLVAARHRGVQDRKKMEDERYLAVWDSIVDLKRAAYNLWEEASIINLSQLVVQTEKAETVVEKNMLLLSDEIIENFSRIIQTIKNYQVNKRSIIELRRASLPNDSISCSDIKNLINSNKSLLVEFTELLKLCQKHMRKQLGRTM